MLFLSYLHEKNDSFPLLTNTVPKSMTATFGGGCHGQKRHIFQRIKTHPTIAAMLIHNAQVHRL